VTFGAVVERDDAATLGAGCDTGAAACAVVALTTGAFQTNSQVPVSTWDWSGFTSHLGSAGSRLGSLSNHDEGQTHRQTGRQEDKRDKRQERQAERQRGRQERQERQADRQRGREAERQTGRQTDRQTDRDRERERETETDRDRPTRQTRQTRHTKRPTDKTDHTRAEQRRTEQKRIRRVHYLEHSTRRSTEAFVQQADVWRSRMGLLNEIQPIQGTLSVA
jgi:hypothetical protein